VKALQRSELVGLHLRTGEKLPNHHYIKQRHFQAKPKHDHAHCTLQVYIPVVPCPTITAYAEPIFKGQVTLQDEILTMSILISSS